ncbi:MAG: hypothetical protein CW716_03425 [Candidatus Bathyarchaeum sp.]|nr:MAG: hypothetical protein CW716_03425 [Candidatus Bathyarchaeum sp.]
MCLATGRILNKPFKPKLNGGVINWERIILKRIIVSVMLLFVLSLFFSSIPNSVCQTENVEVLSYSWYISSLDTFVVIGEVQNVGPNNIEYIALSGTVNSLEDEDQAWSTTVAYSNEILPQQKAPFVMYFFTDDSYSGSFSWEKGDLNNVEFGVIVSNETEKYQYPNLEIVNSSSRIETDGNFTVTGKVVNTGTQESGKLWVVASFYNSTGDIIATGFSDYLLPESLPAGESTSFTVSSTDAVNELVSEMQVLAYKIRDYSLVVQTQAPIIPEFPVLPIVLLFAAVTITGVVFSKKTKLR